LGCAFVATQKWVSHIGTLLEADTVPSKTHFGFRCQYRSSVGDSLRSLASWSWQSVRRSSPVGSCPPSVVVSHHQQIYVIMLVFIDPVNIRTSIWSRSVMDLGWKFRGAWSCEFIVIFNSSLSSWKRSWQKFLEGL
jgi:hypothetical protein